MTLQAHIQLNNNIIATKAIIVGDPQRVDTICQQLENVVHLQFNREFKSALGYYQNKPILVVSTGIGAPSAAIAIEELINIGIKTIIRVGSCGAMQNHINLGELIIPTSCVRDEGLTTNYVPNNFPAIPNLDLLCRAKQLTKQAHFGIIRSHDCFYMDNNSEVEKKWSKLGVIGADLETSALFIIGQLRGIRTLSILNNVVLYQENLNEGINDLVNGDNIVKSGEYISIQLALNILASEENE